MSLNQQEDRKAFGQRATGFFVALLVAVGALAGRLFFLQVVNQKRYALLSDRNRIHTVYILPPRGRILDRDGKILAGIRTEYQAAIDLSQFRSKPETWIQVCTLLNLDPEVPLEEYRSKQAKVMGPSRVVPLKNGLSWEEILAIESPVQQIPGLIVLPLFYRTYPLGEKASHLVGYVMTPRSKDIEENANLKLPGALLGAAGSEKGFDTQLQGTPGFKRYEVNAGRRAVRLLEEGTPIPGRDIRLTLHAGLQERIDQIMKEVRCGALMVMDVESGDILASVSKPSFDPNIFAGKMTPEQWKGLMDNKDFPLLHRAVAGLYAPGSTFKMVVALAALESEPVTEKTTYDCQGYWSFGEQRIHCWRWRTGGHGRMNMVQAIAQSCDVYFYNLAAKLGMTEILKMAKIYGFGEPVLGFPGEQKGSLPTAPPFWRKQDLGRALNLSIGQGHLTVTPLQLLRMTARLATGHLIRPHLLMGESGEEGSLPTSPWKLSIIRRGMAEVVWGSLGTAQLAQDPFFRIAGKTGTAQVVKITAEERRKGQIAQRPYHLRDHALFLGYGPIEKPRFAVVVVVEHGGSGRVAVPLGRDALLAAQELIP